MHNDLVLAFGKMVEMLKNDNRVKGGWHFGSVGRGMADTFSDYDSVFLVADKDFEQFSTDLSKIISQIADELMILWAESFNDNYFKCFDAIIRIGDNLHQIDVFLINYDYPDNWMSKLHCKGCTRENIIFDRNGETGEYLDKRYSVENYIPDTIRAIDTYWFHAAMIVKYLKRKDIFKLIKNNDILFHAHIDLLFSKYDTLDWGSWENKVKHCVPKEKQEHLKAYFYSANIENFEISLKKCISLFKEDAEEICKDKNIEYSKTIPEKIITYFNKNINE